MGEKERERNNSESERPAKRWRRERVEREKFEDFITLLVKGEKREKECERGRGERERGR